MKQILKFTVEDIKLVQELSDSQLAIAEVKVCHDGMNLHEKPISLQAIKDATSTLINKWLVAGFDGVDFKGHEGNAQLIIGFFPKENDFRYVEEDGKTFFIANAIVSKNYASWAFDVFQKENLKECSMEITVLETEQREDGYEWITSYIYNAVTILGHSNSAACPGSDVQITKFSTEELVEKGEKAYSIWAKFSSEEVKNVIKEAVEKFSLNANQIRDILSNALASYKYQNGDYECFKYWINTFDDIYVYVEDEESYKTYRMTYVIEEAIGTINIESAEEVIRGNFIPVNQQESVEEMGSDANVEATAQAELEENQAEVDKELTDEGKEEMSTEEVIAEVVVPNDNDEDNFQAKFEEMCAKYSTLEAQMSEMITKMSASEEQMAVYMAENTTLKEEKMARLEQEKMATVEYSLQEVSDVLPKEKMEELREDAKNFSIENVNIWINKVKAEAFTFSKGQSNGDGITRIGLPFVNENKNQSNSIWGRI